MKFIPHEYQQKAIDRIVNNKRFGLFLDIPLRPAEIDEEDHGERDGRHEAVQSIGTQSPQFSLVHNVSSDEVCSPAMNNNAC